MEALGIELLNGLGLFATLGIVALGLGIVFGLMGVINLAHGEFVMIGAYVAYLVQDGGLNYWLAIPAAAVVLFFVGSAVEMVLIRRIYQKPELTILATFGLSIVLRQLAEILFSKNSRKVSNPIPGATDVFGITFPTYRLVLIVVATLIVVAVLLLFTKSRFGLTVRAIVANRGLAESSGIRTSVANILAFGIGAAAAGVAGVLVAPLVSVDSQIGLSYLPGAFLVVIVGGFTRLWGVVIGAAIVAAVQTGVTHYVDAVWAQIAALVLAVVMLQLSRSGSREVTI